MKKQFLFLAMCITTILSASGQTSVWDGSHSTWTKGTGTQADPYLIENAAQLAHLAYIVNNGIGAGSERIVGTDTYWKLMTDIDLKGSETFQWTPIGYYNFYDSNHSDYYNFGGHFDGNNHTIANLYININSTASKYAGLFGWVSNGSIKNTGIISGNITTTDAFCAAGIAGCVVNTVVDNCHNKVNISFSNPSYYSAALSFGGIVGSCSNGSIINNCFNTGNISSTTTSSSISYSGGIAGFCLGSTINNCYNTSNISSTFNSGGIAGGCEGSGSTINNCYNAGSISSYSGGGAYSGGIVGVSSSTINNCFNTGNISSTTTSSISSSANSGGIVGGGWTTSTINNCYNTGSISSNGNKSGISTISTVTNSYYLVTCGATGTGQSRTAEFMKTAEFVNLLNVDSITYTQDISPLQNNGFPILVSLCGNDTIKTFSASSITQSKAIFNGYVKTNNINVVSKGFQYKLANETGFTNHAINIASDTLTWNVTSLKQNKTYQYRTYAVITTNDTIYGEVRSFVTLPVTVTTSAATNITQSKATLNGTTILGDATVNSKGFEYKLDTAANYTRVNITGSSENIASNLTNLQPNKMYQFRAFAICGNDTIYGDISNFTTLPITVTTLAATNITRSSAVLNGNVTAGDAVLSAVGFEVLPENKSVSLPASDIFSYTLTNLSAATTIQYQAFAVYNNDTIYASDNYLSFTTSNFNIDNNGNYLIEDKDDLILLANLVNGGNSFSGQTFVLANDITLSDTPNNILSIGNYQNGTPFSGTFNGNKNRIYNVYIDQPNTPYQGFFGYTQDAYLYEVGLVNITASGRNYTGGMVGYAENTKIDDSYVSGGTLFALSYCGGLAGYQTPGTNSIITGCYNTCTVSGNNYVGGLLGYSDQGTVRNSYTAALVTGQGSGVGAIIGGAQDVLNYNCYFNDSITGQPFAIGENNISMRAAGDEGNMSSGDMRMQTFVNTLNQGLVTPVWKSDYSDPINNGFPILIWQSNQSTGIIETLHATSLKVYPIPAKDYVFVQSDEPVSKVEIYNQSGVCVSVSKGAAEKLDVSSLPNGFYLARIFVNGMPITKKIIIKK